MKTSSQIVATLQSWNSQQPQIRKSLMDHFRGVKPVSSIELRAKAEDAYRNLLDLEVYNEFMILYLKDLVK